ncbi:glycoside hydrolase family 97 protein, partial [Mariniphaga sediminis]|uniref:glycoside hydrolase family 97 protein n=1 Tax=Mariniphaga sediminis TaxID=1628158 RepID=UPI003568BF31
NEVCELNFAGNSSVLFPEEKSFISHYEQCYLDTILTAISEDRYCSLPALVTSVDGIKVGITETGQSNYPGMFLKGTGSNSLRAIFPAVPLKTEQVNSTNEKIIEEANYIAKVNTPFALPWRCLLIARKDAELIENNIPFLLAEKCVLDDTGWIKAGKAAWEWYSVRNIYGVDFKSGINTDTYKYYIDFASANGIEYIVMDGGWSDNININQPIPSVKIKEIINYGKKKNVGVILWMFWYALLNDLNGYLDDYADWGAAGIKVDFMQRADQLMVNYYEQIASAAAKRKLLVDFHGAFKPNGLQRKYPNVLNFEGVNGGEKNKFNHKITPMHNVTLPFTRMLAGPMDYTPGAMKNETSKGFCVNYTIPMSQGTRCHQAGMYIMYESPLQTLCDNASHYLAEPKFTRFISQIPTTWDETIALSGKVKEYVVVARRNGDKWYIGGMTNWATRDMDLTLDFLDDGEWEIEFVADGINADRYPSDYKLSKEILKSKILKFSMASGGGYAAILKKADQ